MSEVLALGWCRLRLHSSRWCSGVVVMAAGVVGLAHEGVGVGTA